MSTVSSFEFNCSCGYRFRVRPQQGGKSVTCPSCNTGLNVPYIQTAEQVSVPVPTRSLSDVARGAAIKLRLIGGPVSFTTILSYLLLTWLLVGFAFLVTLFFGPMVWLIGLVLFLATTLGVSYHAWQLLQARQRVLHQKEVPLLHGLVRLVAWEPTEGILVLRNKNVVFSDDDLDDARGGIRFVCPVLGEEVGLRAPLEMQTLEFADHDVLTREYLRLSIRATVRWRITDIRNFYLLISRELRGVSDTSFKSASFETDTHEHPQRTAGPLDRLMSSATQWLRALAEAQARTVVSKISSGLLLADRVSQDMPELRASGLFGTDGVAMHEGSHSLAELLHQALSEGSESYGITIVDVALREVRFPEAILEQCVDAARAAYLPMLGRRKAEAGTATLAREAEILGVGAVGTREIMSKAPAIALPDLIAGVIHKQGLGARGGLVGGAAAAAIAAQAVAQKPVAADHRLQEADHES